MERDQWQAQKLIELAYVSEADIRQAYADPRRGPQLDLCALLQASTLLSPEQAQWVRKATSQNPAQMTQIHSAPSTSHPTPGSDSGYIQQVPKAPSMSSGASINQSQMLNQSQSGTINPGDRVGPYTIVRKIGQGGMGMVFEARHETLDQRVALKTLITGSELNEEQLERFEVEAQAMARLRHPNIVRVLDVAIANPTTYMAMEFINGGDLQQLIREKRSLDQKLTAEIGEKLANALFHAHRQSIIHRDMKPANVLLDHQNEPYITDFGLAKQVEDSSRGLTKTGDFLGTPVYMAPEQIENRGFPDGRMDIYSLGVTLYEMLTGVLPFEGATAINIVNQVLSKEPPPPREHRADLDQDLETIVLKCMEKEKEFRYHDARELANDLRAFLNNEAISARRLTAFERFQKWQRRNRGLTRGLASMAAVALILLFTGGLFSFRAISSEKDEKEKQAADAEALREAAEKQERTAKRQAQLALASVALEKGYTLLSQNRCRAAASAFLEVQSTLKKLQRLEARGHWTDGEETLVKSARLGLREAAVRSGYVNNVARGDTNTGVLDREGRIFVSYQSETSRDHFIRAFDCVNNAVLWKSENLNGIVSTIRIAPDGKRFAVTINDTNKNFSQLQLRNIETGQLIWKRDFKVEGKMKNPVGPLDFSHDSAGKYLCTGGWPSTYVLETNTGKILRTFNSRRRRNAGYPNPTYSVSFSDDDRLVASAYPDGTMSFWDLNSGQDVWFGNFGRVRYAQFLSRLSPARPFRFVLSSHSGQVSIFELNEKSVAEKTRILASGEYGDCTFLYQSSSKRLFAAGFTDGSLVVWNKIGVELCTLQHPGVVNCTISQDDRFVVTVGEDAPRRWRIDRTNAFRGQEGPIAFTDDDHIANVSIRLPDRAPFLNIIDYQGAERTVKPMTYGKDDFGIIVSDLKMTPDLRHLAVIRKPYNTQADQTSRIELWPMNSEEKPRVLKQMFASSIAFSPDGKLLALGLDQNNQSERPDFAIIKKYKDGSIVKTVGPSVQGVRQLTFTSDGKRLVTGALDGTAAIYEVAGKSQLPVQIFDMQSSKFSKYVDGKGRLIRKDPQFMSFEDATENIQVLFGRIASNRQSAGRLGVFSLCLSPDESTLVAGCGDSFGRVFDLARSEVKKPVTGHDHRIIFSRFSQGGELLITASSDGTIHIWDWRTRHVLRTIRSTLPLLSVDLSPNGKRLAGMSVGSVIWVWDVYIPKIKAFRDDPKKLFNTLFPN